MKEHKDIVTESTMAYLANIRNCLPVGRNQEAELTRRIRAGDEKAREQLVTANLHFAVKVAKSYVGRGLPLIELISEANLGLIQAANRFDERRGFKFITYAVWWIRQAIRQALTENSRIVHQPANRLLDRRRIEQAVEQGLQKTGHRPTLDAIAGQAGLSPKRLRAAQDIGQIDISLDAPLAHNPHIEQSEYFAHPGKDADELITEIELTEALAGHLKSLGERDAWILSVHFGLEGCKPMSLQAIGATLGLTRERIRQLRNEALGKLRKRHGRTLREFAPN